MRTDATSYIGGRIWEVRGWWSPPPLDTSLTSHYHKFIHLLNLQSIYPKMFLMRDIKRRYQNKWQRGNKLWWQSSHEWITSLDSCATSALPWGFGLFLALLLARTCHVTPSSQWQSKKKPESSWQRRSSTWIECSGAQSTHLRFAALR